MEEQMSRKGGEGSGRSFTLVEMLTVMGIVAILMSLLLPALGRARQKASQIQCLSNLRQLATAMTLYADSWRGRLPPYVTAARPEEHPGLNWAGWSFPYHNNPRLLVCSAGVGKIPAATPQGFRDYDASYGWNYDGTQGNRGPLATAIRQPSLVYLLCDSGDPCLIYGANTWDNLMEELDLDWDSQLEGANRHRGQVNAAFVDGHASSRELEEFLGAPCTSLAPPWHIPWEGGVLEKGVIPFPDR